MAPNHKGILHSGAGRIAEWEWIRCLGDLSKELSLKDICNSHMTPKMTREIDLWKIIEYIIRGGGELVLYYNNDDMFWWHSIAIDIDVSREAIDANIVGWILLLLTYTIIRYKSFYHLHMFI